MADRSINLRHDRFRRRHAAELMGVAVQRDRAEFGDAGSDLGVRQGGIDLRLGKGSLELIAH
ncbi:hypothetical protein [Bradyrhizobium sp. CCBAU 53415]|uniref:hypothetical protein n=1 Tax=Bradyrhizobium sp. CCBAU 53415 TaxID=1325119 RepID=UPI002306723D|nr:hypothetical protein [Bradyrhizobium sp. CCBAU 53415]